MDKLNKSLGKVRGFDNRYFSFENVYQMKNLVLGLCCKAEVISLTRLCFPQTFVVTMVLNSVLR